MSGKTIVSCIEDEIWFQSSIIINGIIIDAMFCIQLVLIVPFAIKFTN